MKNYRKDNYLKPIVGLLVGILVGIFMLVDFLRLKETQATALGLPEPTSVVAVSRQYNAPFLRGIKLDEDNPFKIEFLVDTASKNDISKQEASSLIKYFMAALTVPAEALWVNLSPYEHDRIIPEKLGKTDLGEVLLKQDYLLKQVSASLTHPETEIGKDYWSAVDMTQTYNKIWVVADKADVYKRDNSVLISEATLKVMTEEDYLARENSTISSNVIDASDVLRNKILPAIEKDINYGKNFSKLRQVYSAVILASWFKDMFMDDIYGSYVDRQKISGLELEDLQLKNKVYALYVDAFTKGVYNFSRKEIAEGKNKKVHRSYFSGGLVVQPPMNKVANSPMFDGAKKHLTVTLKPEYVSSAMSSSEKIKSYIEKLKNNDVSRVVAIGDIHGDLEDFERALADIEEEGYDQVIFSGDYMDKGLYGLAVIERLQELSKGGKVIPLLGNHDINFIRAMEGDQEGFMSFLTLGGTKVLDEAGIKLSLFDYLPVVSADISKMTEDEIELHDKKIQDYHDGLAKQLMANLRLKNAYEWMKANLRIYHIDSNGLFYAHSDFLNPKFEVDEKQGFELLKHWEEQRKDGTLDYNNEELNEFVPGMVNDMSELEIKDILAEYGALGAVLGHSPTPIKRAVGYMNNLHGLITRIDFEMVLHHGEYVGHFRQDIGGLAIIDDVDPELKQEFLDNGFEEIAHHIKENRLIMRKQIDNDFLIKQAESILSIAEANNNLVKTSEVKQDNDTGSSAMEAAYGGIDLENAVAQTSLNSNRSNVPIDENLSGFTFTIEAINDFVDNS